MTIKNRGKNETKIIIICGSIVFRKKILDLKARLSEKNVPCVVPEDENKYNNSKSQIHPDLKRLLSQKYFRLIRDKRTKAILVANYTKHNIKNYIGPNVFAEIVTAVGWSRKVFLLFDYPDDKREELVAWKVIPLHNNIDKLIEFFFKPYYTLRNNQLDLFNKSNKS